MSYEGYEQLICDNGHYTERDCYSDCDAPCELCGAEMKHSRSVDQTNDSGNPSDIEIVTEAEFDECPTCHHKTKTKSATYRFK